MAVRTKKRVAVEDEANFKKADAFLNVRLKYTNTTKSLGAKTGIKLFRDSDNEAVQAIFKAIKDNPDRVFQLTATVLVLDDKEDAGELL